MSRNQNIDLNIREVNVTYNNNTAKVKDLIKPKKHIPKNS